MSHTTTRSVQMVGRLLSGSHSSQSREEDGLGLPWSLQHPTLSSIRMVQPKKGAALVSRSVFPSRYWECPQKTDVQRS